MLFNTRVLVSLTLSASSVAVLAAPLPNPAPESVGGSGGDAYTGVGGQSNGGNAYEVGHSGGLDLLNLASNNAGHGGDASSGTAFGGRAGDVGSQRFSAIASNDRSASLAGSLIDLDVLSRPKREKVFAMPAVVYDRDMFSKRQNGGSAYTGVGGQSNGGNAASSGSDLLNIGSGKAGSGGDASSGDAFAGKGGDSDSTTHHIISSPQRSHSPLGNLLDLDLLRRDGGSAYTGVGGQSNGGNSYDTNAAGLPNHQVLNTIDGPDAFSHNAGKGGDASSGNAVAGSDHSESLL